MLPVLLAAIFALPGSPAAPMGPSAFVADVEPQRVASDKNEARHQADLKQDAAEGAKYAEQVDKELKASQNAEYVDRVRRIGAEIAKIANSTRAIATWGDDRGNRFDYKFKVVQGDDVNAFSLPGGYIYVFEGLVKFAQSDDELAGVLGHEIAHASFRHLATMEREQSKIQTWQIPIILAAIISGRSRTAGDLMQVGQLVGQASASGWSVSAEKAADYGGFQYLVKSKYDPTGLLTFMERLAMKDRATETIDLGIFRTHPPSRARADAILAQMTKAGLPVRRSRVTKSFRATSQSRPDGAIEILFGDRKLVAFVGANAQERAIEAIRSLNRFFDSSPELFELRAGKSGQILGGGRPVLQILPIDAVAAGTSLDELTGVVVSNMKASIYSLGYRIWGSHS